MIAFPYVSTGHYIRGFRFDFLIADEVAAQWYASANQSMPEREWCLEHLRPGDSVIDCGAHHGMMSVIFAKAVGSTGHVYAYEALPSNADIIRENAKLNSLDNLSVRSVGVSDRNGEASFHRNSGNIVLSDVSDGEKINVTRLDDDLPESFKVDFLKIDVEGSDLEAMRGGMRVISQRPIINLELHNFLFADRMQSLIAIFSLLAPLHYRYTVLPEIWGDMQPEVGEIDLGLLSTFDNPHVFCVPA